VAGFEQALTNNTPADYAKENYTAMESFQLHLDLNYKAFCGCN
jgi:hypothetical protein